MLFLGHLRPQNEEDVRESTWKEVIHKANVRLIRVPIDALYSMPGVPQSCHAGEKTSTLEMPAEARVDEYAYQLVIVEDLDDDRAHTFDDDEPQPGPYGDVNIAGIREAVPIHELSKIFYADTGKILNIGSEGESNSPVLLLKRDLNAVPPRRMMSNNVDNEAPEYNSRSANDPLGTKSHCNSNALPSSIEPRQESPSTMSPSTEQQVAYIPKLWCLPADLDPEWIAFEVYTETEDSDTESEADLPVTRPTTSSRTSSAEPSITSELSRLNVSTPTTASSPPQHPMASSQQQVRPSLPPIRTSLSLLETLLRLLSLQQFQQTPHLSIPDELLTFFLSESASTGAASNDAQERKRLREDARRRVGFDPYDESPVKRRGEEYQYRGSGGSDRWDDDGRSYSQDRYGSPMEHESQRYEDEGYDTRRNWTLPQNSRSLSTPRDMTPHTTPLMLKHRSRSGTPPPNEPASPGERPQPLSRWSGVTRNGLREAAGAAGRMGSPLARPQTGITDEGLGTSPASVIDGERK